MSTKHFLRSEIPVWIAILIFTAMISGTFMITRYFRDAVEEYSLFMSRDDGTVFSFDYGARPALENANFFMDTKRSFIDAGAHFLEADLSEMRISVYEDGMETFSAPILTKGREGSWWETPAGVYRIELKEDNHFSSMGKVYQPWSMVFQGNFFIHGWPYYPDGTPVASTYSGGCIRLDTEDAKEIYDRVRIGTPILVYEKDFIEDDFAYMSIVPDMRADTFLAVDLHNNYVFMEEGSNTEHSIASLTKLMTALIATEYINLEKEITITEKMIVPTSRARLNIGDSFSAYELLYPLLLESSNEAAEAIAGFLGRERFISLMNKKAAALGMEHTRFTDPSGIDGGNISTARDCFLLAKYMYNNRRFILDMTSDNVGWSAYGSPPFDDLGNFNIFEEHPAFVGGKTGKSTPAKETIMSIFEVSFGNDVRPIALIALGTDDMATDIRNMYTFITERYTEER
jgi:hypothetical protein